MSLRWRKDGRLVCAAMTIVEPGDIYFDDRQHEALSERGIILADPEHEHNALWHWAGHLIPDWNVMRHSKSVIEESIDECRRASAALREERQREIDRENHIRKHGPWYKKLRLWILDNMTLP